MPEDLSINVIGIMTGNSLDGADLVLTSFSEDGTQKDLATFGLPTDALLKEQLQWVREKINEAKGDVGQVANGFAAGAKTEKFSFNQVSDAYIDFIGRAVNGLRERAKQQDSEVKIDLIGFHGQTCAHFPPSIAKSKDRDVIYTVQIGDGQKLADLTGIPVIFDFRSDDLMNLGEAAPLAPVHHQHLAKQTRLKGQFPIAFCNAGNTGNITIITENKTSGELVVQGWDTGPFNNFPDKLMQAEKNLACDRDGAVGQQGQVNTDLLRKLFFEAVVTKAGENFLTNPPPRSSDPEWYKILPELSGQSEVAGQILSFADRVRTAEYFSAYIYFHTLGFLSEDLNMPGHFAVCGGGWKNPLSFEHFQGLIKADFKNNLVLTEHLELFQNIQKRITRENNAPDFEPQCAVSEAYGFDGTAMEARIFADAAYCRITGEPFSMPSTTGVTKPTVAGIIRFPQGKQENCSESLKALIKEHDSLNLTVDRPELFDVRWNRASAGWAKRLAD